MSVELTINGTAYEYPEVGDSNWGIEGTGWATAVTQGMLQKAGGLFSLTAEVDFGANYGLKALYYKSRTVNPAAAGQVRIAKTDSISFRNNANSGDVSIALDGSDKLTFNGSVVRTGLIVNADVDAAAAIAFSKMAALTASRALVSDSSGVVGVSTATSTEVGYLSGVTGAIQTALDAKLPKAGGTMTGALTLYGAPASSLEAATKAYVDSLATGLNAKTAVVVATTGAGTLASSFENGDTIDGVVLATGNRILIKDQAAPAENGIYVVAGSGAPARATDADTWAELVAAYCFVSSGTANASTSWVCNVAAGGTLGVTAVTFVQFSAAQAYTASGQGITLSGNTFSLQLDSTTLSQSGSGVKVNAIANTQIAAAAGIAVNKLAALTASRAVVSDGSGFLASATTTATEIGYVNGLTSSAQTQISARITAATMTTNGDLITRAAGVPDRIAIGSTGQVLTVVGGAPAWATSSGSAKTAVYAGTHGATVTITTTPTALPITQTIVETGGLISRSTSVLSFASVGFYRIIAVLTYLTSASYPFIYVRVQNTTDATTSAAFPGGANPNVAPNFTYCFIFEVTNTAKAYEVQANSSSTNITIGGIVAGAISPPFSLSIDYLGT